ncbi:MAG TPA: ABC transporter substrate-binding protein [Vicinamibacterales bacterium]
MRGLIGLLTSETWLTVRPDGRQSERVIKAWDYDRDRTHLHLTLREDVYFQDGTKLEPALAVEALANTAAHPADEGVLSFESVKSVTASGPNGIEVELKEPNAFIVPDLSIIAVKKPDSDSIGTGPFRLVSRDDQGAHLSAFAKYYRGRPSVADITLTNYPTQRNAWAALMRGDIDMLYEVSREAVDFVAAETTINTYTVPRPFYIPLVFNIRHPILKNREVRKAINEALDRAALVRDGMNGRGRPAVNPIWPEHWAQSPSNPQFEYDPDGAKRRLDEAGFKERAGSAVSRFSFNCVVFAEDSRFERLALLVQKELADVGIDMRLVAVQEPDIEARLHKGDFDAVLFEMYGRSLSYAYDFWHSHPDARLNTGYTGADAVLDRIRASKSDDEMRAGVSAFAQVLHEDPPAAFIAWQQASRAVSTRFDVASEPGRDILSNAWQWRLADARGQGSQ